MADNEKVKPEIERSEELFNASWWFRCPECHDPIDYKQAECGWCHKKIDWSDYENWA